MIDGLKFLLRKNTSDFFVVDEVFRKGVYGKNPSGTVFDVGANIGAYALYAAKTALRVFSFEPEMGNYKHLERNLSLNNFENIKIYKKAIGDSTKRALLFKAHVNKGMSSTAVAVGRC